MATGSGLSLLFLVVKVCLSCLEPRESSEVCLGHEILALVTCGTRWHQIVDVIGSRVLARHNVVHGHHPWSTGLELAAAVVTTGTVYSLLLQVYKCSDTLLAGDSPPMTRTLATCLRCS